MSRGSRARPLLDAPNPVDSLDDPTRDAARRPLESRNHGWDGRLPPEAACLAGKKWPAQSSHATRGDAALYGVVRALARAPIQSGPLRFARCLGRKGTWSLAPSRARRAGRPSKPAPACPPVPSARAAHRSLRQGARARPISAAGSVCLSVYRDGWIGSSLAGYAGAYAHIYMDGWVGVCVSPRMDAAGGPCRHRPRRRRAALRCRQGRARAGQLVTSGASRVRLGVSRPGVGPWRAPANWSPPVPASVSLGQRLRQLVTLPPARAAPPAPPTRPPHRPPPPRHPADPARTPAPAPPRRARRRPRGRRAGARAAARGRAAWARRGAPRGRAAG
ncbi:hypothetical protein KXX37_007940, partial [Aspergillus fumigatus]